MPHLTLVGDSVFDNDRYTYGAPDVASCLRELLPEWSVTLQARDGATLRQVGGQLAKLPAETTHVVASMGGNDLLALPFVMPARTATTGEFLAWLAREAQDFEQKYRLALRELISLNRVLTVCTVTGAGLPGDKGVNLRVLLNVFNDVIVRASRRSTACASSSFAR